MPATLPALRVGIDVGGTFTDVVVVEAGTRTIVARIKVPTTHTARAGVAEGIVTALRQALAVPGIDVARIAFIAHSTTQATNALLEGDVASVGIVGLHGPLSWLARTQLRVPPIAMRSDHALAPRIAYARQGDRTALERAVNVLLASGAQAIVASEAFGVDAPAREREVVAYARERGAVGTAGHEVSTTYGLRARTRTAVLNAAILPRMQQTSRLTAESVAAAGIGVPLMIMRSDGGVMDVGEVARRPILTMLSGPAAGIAGALLHENVTDGIFIEVGGTSADCSVIRRGQPQTRPARVGRHRTMLRTLDVRTLAIAGGSIPRLDFSRTGTTALRDVGPRSAHIAGLRYASFTETRALENAGVTSMTPLQGDPDDYLVLSLADGTKATLTPTCAANLLEYVPRDDFAAGNVASARVAFERAGEHFRMSAEHLARAMLERAADKLRIALDELIAEYELERDDVELVGGGGGAAALVPFVAERLGFRHRLAHDAEVISPLGVALALVRDVVERTIVAPSADDIVRVRREAVERVVTAGAARELVEVTVEIDGRRNLVRAIASGATGAAAAPEQGRRASDEECAAAAARSLRAELGTLADPVRVGSFALYAAVRGGRESICAVDARAVVRLVARSASVRVTKVGRVESSLAALLDEMTTFGDVGRALPEIHLIYEQRVVDLGTLGEAEQIVALAREELRGLDADVSVAIVAARRQP